MRERLKKIKRIKILKGREKGKKEGKRRKVVLSPEAVPWILPRRCPGSLSNLTRSRPELSRPSQPLGSTDIFTPAPGARRPFPLLQRLPKTPERASEPFALSFIPPGGRENREKRGARKGGISGTHQRVDGAEHGAAEDQSQAVVHQI